MEYPVLECKAASLNFWNIGFPMIFAVAFGLFGVLVILMSISESGESWLVFVGVLFLMIGIGGAPYKNIKCTYCLYRNLAFCKGYFISHKI